MRYTPHTPDDACLDLLFRLRFPEAKKFNRLRGKNAYVDNRGNQIFPLSGTIFEHSVTPLSVWFQAITCLVITERRITARELQRHIGVTYKTAWRMKDLIVSALEGKEEFALINKKAQEVNHGGVTFPGNRYVYADGTPKHYGPEHLRKVVNASRKDPSWDEFRRLHSCCYSRVPWRHKTTCDTLIKKEETPSL